LKKLLTRTVTGLLFVAVIVGAIVYSPISFASVFVIISALAINEFVTLMNNEHIRINKTIVIAGGIYLFLAFTAFCANISGSSVFLPYLILLIYIMVSELYRKQPSPLLDWGYAMLTQLYIALPFALLNVLYYQRGPNDTVTTNYVLPLSIFVFLWLNDTGAYCFGTLLGKHRLFERISPKKSWEGSIGGGIITIAAAVGCAFIFPFMSVLAWMGLALVIVVFGTWGDLTESLFKRQLEIKDSGSILPGHGGILDRFDSSLIAIPAAVCYLYFITL